MSLNPNLIKGDRARLSGSRQISVAPCANRPLNPEVSGGDQSPHPRDVDAIVRSARTKAAAVLRRARRQRNEIAEEARERGYRTGHRQGLERAEALLAEIESWWGQLRREEDERNDVLEASIADLVVEITSRVLGSELAADPEVILRLVEESLRRFSEVSDVTLAVSRADLPLLLEHRDHLEAQLPPRTHLLLTSSQELGSGEFHIRGDEGIIVGSVADIAASLRRRIEDGEREEG